MKKYYFKESGKEVEFGDRIMIDLTEEQENGTELFHHMDCKFHPCLVEDLLESGVIVEKEVDDEEEECEEDGMELEDIYEILCEILESQTTILDEIKNIKNTLKEKKASK